MRLINTTIILFCLLLALGYSNGAPKPQSSSSEDEKIVFVAQPTEDQSQDEIVIIKDPVDIVTKPDANGATAVFVSSGQGGNVSGTIHFTETDDGVLVQGEIFGLQPGKHGFHIHKNGSLEQGCKAADSHFNPHNKNHGSKVASEHHVGDLGNVLTPEFGQTSIIIFDKGLLLDPDSPEYIVGRTIIVHEKVDDLGQGGDDESLKTGNAGARLACGIITLN